MPVTKSRLRPVVCAGCDAPMDARDVQYRGGKPHCEGCAEDYDDDVSRDPAWDTPDPVSYDD